ncbi:hypothetical protein ACFL6G_08610 [candidate division KSB1 bacterium]
MNIQDLLPKSIPLKVWKYVGIFIFSVVMLTVSFNYFQDFYTIIFLKPLSIASFKILEFLGLPVSFDGAALPFGSCDLVLPHQILRINFGCTGLFILFIYISGVIAFPAGIRYKMTGLALGISIFTVYSIIRLVIMGLVGNWLPQYLNIIHNYLMVIINLAFVLWLYTFWIKYATRKDTK